VKTESVARAHLGLSILALTCGCCGDDIGKPCDLTVDAGPREAVANTISLTCESHLCLKPSLSPKVAPVAPPTGAGCSAECSQAGTDCGGWELRDSTNPSDTRCKRGFICAVPFEVGQLCCRKLCVCKDFLAPNQPLVPVTCTNRDALTSCQQIARGSVPLVGQQTDFYLDVAPDRPSGCLETQLVDTDLSTIEVDPDCRAVYRVPTVDAKTQVTGYRDVEPPLPRCPAGATTDNVSRDCWRLVHDIGICPGVGQLVSIVRGTTTEEPLVEGTQVAMKCWTCPALISSVGCPG
jgi:hypothetical protein